MFMGEPAAATRGGSVIRLHRQGGFFRDSLRGYRVRIDGSPVGRILSGETKDFFVPPGRHRVRLTLDRFWTSHEAVLEIHADEVAEFTCRPSTWTMPSLVLGLVRPHRWTRLNAPTVTIRT
jgi:hypothetical protein